MRANLRTRNGPITTLWPTSLHTHTHTPHLSESTWRGGGFFLFSQDVCVCLCAHTCKHTRPPPPPGLDEHMKALFHHILHLCLFLYHYVFKNVSLNQGEDKQDNLGRVYWTHRKSQPGTLNLAEEGSQKAHIQDKLVASARETSAFIVWALIRGNRCGAGNWYRQLIGWRGSCDWKERETGTMRGDTPTPDSTKSLHDESQRSTAV